MHHNRGCGYDVPIPISTDMLLSGSETHSFRHDSHQAWCTVVVTVVAVVLVASVVAAIVAAVVVHRGGNCGGNCGGSDVDIRAPNPSQALGL